ALACYRNARRLDPRDPRWSYYEGLLLEIGGHLEEAAEIFRSVVAQEPQNLPARIYLAECLAGLNRNEEAEVLVRDLLKEVPESTSGRALLGELAQSAGRSQEAVELLEGVLADVPEANRLHYPLAQAYRSLGNVEKAKEHLALHGPVGLRPPDPRVEALLDIPQGERVHLLQGRLAFQAGRYGEAVDAFTDAVAARPDSARARVNLASALGLTGATGEAMKQYRKALELDPDNATAHFNLGVLLSRQGELEEALTNLEAAVDAHPADAGALVELASVERRLGQVEAALAHYRKARGLAPQDERSWFEASSLLVDLGRYQEALSTLEDAVAQLPDQGRLLHGLARLLAAVPDESLRDGERALELATAVFNTRRSLSHAETVAMALAELGRCDEAATWQRNVVEEAERSGQTQRLETLRNTLALYEQGGTCRYRFPGGSSISDSGDGAPTPEKPDEEERS
ncbi:MAG: tetratricopeptide repeat protein, partial [Acidobacteria bacterium]|nr:tetratricopeptide repeat protein [Acidobacteriota bacterium]